MREATAQRPSYQFVTFARPTEALSPEDWDSLRNVLHVDSDESADMISSFPAYWALYVGFGYLDLDAIPELFVVNYSPAYCAGMFGCSARVFRRVVGGWAPLRPRPEGDATDEFHTEDGLWIRDEVVDGLRTMLADNVDEVYTLKTVRAPDERVVFRPAVDQFMQLPENLRAEIQVALAARGSKNPLIALIDANGDGDDKNDAFVAFDCPDVCDVGLYYAHEGGWEYTDRDLRRFATVGGWVGTRPAADGRPWLYLRDEFLNGHRTYYDGPQRERTPFP